MNRCLTDLCNLLDLETLEVNLFRGQSRDLGGKSVFGGQVISQALVAATRTVVDAQSPHSLHAYFLRPGDMEAPIVYEVDRVRDGRSFITRRVQAIQHGQPILTLIASFQRAEDGFEHQMPMPQVPTPEQLGNQHAQRLQWLEDEVARNPAFPERLRIAFTREQAFEFLWVDATDPFQPQPGPMQQGIWFRAAGQLPDDPLLHRCVLAYASDFNLAATALLPHARSWFSPEMIVASIDHALWFHRDMRVDDWLFYSMDTPTAQSVRGMTRGLIYDRQGRLVASAAQECLMRPVRPN
ncbi:MAG: acyl-CoA thioesterase II [Gammaproteobacteria bacterium]|nr:acyl-CoA thioesterase II [Gammaproteobacteria bacterium]